MTNASDTAGGAVGSPVLSDSATLSGGNSISGGSITFTLTAPDNSTTTVGTVPVSGAGTYDAPTVLATEVGTYTWHASYSGDSQNYAAIDDGTNESRNHRPGQSGNRHQRQRNRWRRGRRRRVERLGHDQWRLQRLRRLDHVHTRPRPITAPSPSARFRSRRRALTTRRTVIATQVGTYTWHASYSGDGLNNGAIDDGTNESVTTSGQPRDQHAGQRDGRWRRRQSPC